MAAFEAHEDNVYYFLEYIISLLIDDKWRIQSYLDTHIKTYLSEHFLQPPTMLHRVDYAAM